MTEKQRWELLQPEGFCKDDNGSDAWFSSRRRMWFSRTVLLNHAPEWLRAKLKELVPDAEYWFYFQREPENFKEIVREFDLTGATAIIKLAGP